MGWASECGVRSTSYIVSVGMAALSFPPFSDGCDVSDWGLHAALALISFWTRIADSFITGRKTHDPIFADLFVYFSTHFASPSAIRLPGQPPHYNTHSPYRNNL